MSFVTCRDGFWNKDTLETSSRERYFQVNALATVIQERRFESDGIRAHGSRAKKKKKKKKVSEQPIESDSSMLKIIRAATTLLMY
jgi:hypothetical protein